MFKSLPYSFWDSIGAKRIYNCPIARVSRESKYIKEQQRCKNMLFATREEIYGVPHPPMPPHYKTVHTQENNKVADIRDAFNRLWFRVFLNGVEQSSAAFGMNYTIEVVNYTIKDSVTGEITPLTILTIPDAGSVEPLTNFKKAMKIYDDCV